MIPAMSPQLYALYVLPLVLGVPAPAAAQQRGGGQPQPAREVTVAGIPGVAAAGAAWTRAGQGTDTADGLVGTDDGGLLFAQEQPSQISKLDRDGRPSI